MSAVRAAAPEASKFKTQKSILETRSGPSLIPYDLQTIWKNAPAVTRSHPDGSGVLGEDAGSSESPQSGRQFRGRPNQKHNRYPIGPKPPHC